MPGLNGRARGDGRLRQRHRATTLTLELTPVRDAHDVHGVEAEADKLVRLEDVERMVQTMISESNALAAELREALRLQRIRADQQRRLYERAERSWEKQVAALTLELANTQRHSDSLKRAWEKDRSLARIGESIARAQMEFIAAQRRKATAGGKS